MNELVIYPQQVERTISNSPINIGIDLGTTYALMAIVDNKNVVSNNINKIPVQFVSFQQSSPNPYDPEIQDEKIATIVAIHDEKPYVGNNLYHLKGQPEFDYKKNIFYHWKIELGIDHHPLYPDAVSEKLDMPYKIAGAIMNFMHKSFNNSGEKLSNAIITVPASFQANQRNDVLKAAEIANLVTSDNMLIDEPNAAFLGYFNRLGFEKKQEWAQNVKNKNLLVLDYGGGTLDLSLLNIDFDRNTGINISNKAISRYNDLGGQDLDMLIAEEFLLPKIEKCLDESIDSLDITDIQNILLPQLSVIGETLKIEICDAVSLKLGSGEMKDLNLEGISFTKKLNIVRYRNEEYDLGDITISAKEFYDLFRKLFAQIIHKFKNIDKTITCISTSISEIINKANETLDSIDYVLFVGGSSFNPFLGMLTKEKLVNAEMLISSEPDKLVAEGAAVYSYFLNQMGVSLIKPITSDDLGVRLKGNKFYPIIERGAQLPKKVEIPDFRLQTNLIDEIVVPVCIDNSDFSIGEIRCRLSKPFDIDTVISIKAEITKDKVFSLEVYAGDELLGGAIFDNPFAVGRVTEKELEVIDARKKLNQAKVENDKRKEKQALANLIKMYFDSDDNMGGLENTENFIKKFDDQDSWAWNAKYIFNSRLGRKGAAKKALERAIELAPYSAAWRHNFAILIEEENTVSALEYLENLDQDLQEDSTIQCLMARLKFDIYEDRQPAIDIANEYINKPNYFNDFDKRIYLKRLHEIAQRPFNYEGQIKEKNKNDEDKYLDSSNLPLEF